MPHGPSSTRKDPSLSNELSGKVAIVTGGSSGIGRGTAEKFLEEGARVVIADVDREKGEEFAGKFGGDAAFKQTDVSQQDDVRALVAFAVEQFGGLDIMFNNAGISGARHPRLLDEDFADFDRVMAINLLGVMVGTREAARQMATSGGGSIINISSIGGIQSAPGLWAYHTSKASVIMFTKCAAVDVGEYGVRVNAIAPGNIETSILGGVLGAGMADDEREALMATVREFLLSRQAIKRQGTTDDIANAAVYFGSDRSSYVTGTVLPVDAGIVAGTPPSATQFEEITKRAKKG